MHRRDFLRNTGAVAATVAAGTATAGSGAAAPAGNSAHTPEALARHAGTLRLVLAPPANLMAYDESACRLARRIEAVSAGRMTVEVASGSAHTDPDLALVGTDAHTHHHPAFAFFAGLPGSHGLDSAAYQMWLAVGGGQMLWDELAAGYGFKPLLAGHTGPSTGLWSNRALQSAADFAGIRIAATGAAAAALGALGADVVEVPSHELEAAFAGGRIDAAERLGPLAAVSPAMRPLARYLYAPGPTPEGTTLTLAVQFARWSSLSPAEQAILEVCALAEFQAALADAHAHAFLAHGAGRLPQRLPLPPALAAALEGAAGEVVDTLAASDPVAGRIAASLRHMRSASGSLAS